MSKNKKIIPSDLKAFIRELVRESLVKGKTLYAFDLDDTLIKTDSSVIVRNKGKETKLTAAAYALYKPQPEDELDFSEFSYIKEPKFILRMVKLFLDSLSKTSSLSKTIILTARTPDITDDIRNLLNSRNLPQIDIHAVGSSDPFKKADVIQDYINKGYTNISFFDDSKPNVNAIKDLKNIESNKDKGVNIRAVHIVHSLEEAGKDISKKDESIDEDIHDPVKPGILKKRLGKLSCTKVREARAKLKDKGTHYAKALQRYINYQCKD